MAGVAQILGTDVVVNGKGENVKIVDICEGKDAIGIYFSAHWCPPCRGFTPVLAKFYDKNKDHFECIFVSSDRDEASFKEYFGEMPWYALDFSRRDLKTQVSSTYKVQGIPTLVILKPDGTVINASGRSVVADAGDKFPKEWSK